MQPGDNQGGGGPNPDPAPLVQPNPGVDEDDKSDVSEDEQDLGGDPDPAPQDEALSSDEEDEKEGQEGVKKKKKKPDPAPDPKKPDPAPDPTPPPTKQPRYIRKWSEGKLGYIWDNTAKRLWWLAKDKTLALLKELRKYSILDILFEGVDGNSKLTILSQKLLTFLTKVPLLSSLLGGFLDSAEIEKLAKTAYEKLKSKDSKAPSGAGKKDKSPEESPDMGGLGEMLKNMGGNKGKHEQRKSAKYDDDSVEVKGNTAGGKSEPSAPELSSEGRLSAKFKPTNIEGGFAKKFNSHPPGEFSFAGAEKNRFDKAEKILKSK